MLNAVDEILAAGRYTDYPGHVWELCTVADCREQGKWWSFNDMARNGGRHLTVAQMRLLIERDQHRDECPRVGVCQNHPVPRVTFCDVGGFDIWAAGELARAEFARPCIATLPEAMDAARALAMDS